MVLVGSLRPAAAQQSLPVTNVPSSVTDPGGNRLVWQPTSDRGGYLDLDRLPPTADYPAAPPGAGLNVPRSAPPGTPWIVAQPGYGPGAVDPALAAPGAAAAPGYGANGYGAPSYGANGYGYGGLVDGDAWSWQLLPSSLIYKSYLAGLKESRLASQHTYIKDQGWTWDAVLGARIGLLRYGNQDPVRPDGFQVDAEASAQPRLDVPDDVNLHSADFRAGVPLTWGNGPFRTKLGYYHLSSHLGDEFLLANPGYDRLNYSRDCIVLGETVFLTDELRVYGEVAWAFHSDVCDPWELQFGLDYAPVRPTGWSGAPFFAVNGHLRQEVNFGGTFVLESGWSWLSDQNARLLRFGLQYFNGQSPQFSFYQRSEQAVGLGIWYDF